ncbi:MAG: ribokinase [Clostridia bacterium]|nr:ribokinase [Clostridia bacterium]
MKDIYVLGSLNMDLCIESPYIPTKGETIVGSNFLTNGGGKGANQATAASKLGGNVFMCGAVGNDSFGKTLLKDLETAGVNVNQVKTINGVSTGIAVILLSQGDNRIILDKGANALVTKADVDNFLSSSKTGDIFLTQLENPIEIVGYALKTAKEKGLFTILNPAPANKEIIPFLKWVDLIVPNETEMELLGGKDSLFANGISRIVTTLGEKGYEISDKTSAMIYPCIKVKVVDTTAAGDTLCGGLAVGLSRDKSLEKSCEYGSKAASIACTLKGAQRSIPTEKEVNEYNN